MTKTEDDPRLESAFTLFEAGRLGEAEIELREVLAHEPQSVLGLHLLAIIAAQTKRRPMAIELLLQVIALEPDSSEAGSDLGHLLTLEGRHSEAIGVLEKARDADPLSFIAHNGLGEVYIAAHRPRDAQTCFEKAIALSPQSAVATYNLGVALQAQDRETEAAAKYREAISFDPALAEPHMRLGNLLYQGEDREGALILFRRISELQPESVAGRMALAILHFERGQAGSAETNLRAALRGEPDNSEALCFLGQVLAGNGQFEDARGCFSRILAKNPQHARAYAGIANAKAMTDEDRPLLDNMLSQLGRSDMTERDRAIVQFAIGKTFGDLGEYESAISHYDEANRIEARRLRAAGRTLDPQAHAASIESLIQTFTPDFFSRYARSGVPSDLPVLIVGMPRSGTTLVEQILSNHPQIAAGDELTFWNKKCATIAAKGDLSFNIADAQHLAHEYLALLKSIDENALRVSDKMPQNFLHLGLVHLALPKARIIHCRRNPIDTCLSMYFTHFGVQRDFAFDRAGIVFFYQQYLKLIGHWAKVLPPDRFLEIDYERLVTNPEPVVRQMIAFCGLDWNDACLHPERNRRLIRTASMWQARQSVYTTSAGRWRRYEPWLGEFRALIPPDVTGTGAAA